VLVAHAAAHDVAFLCAELGRCGRAWERAHYLDTLALSRRCLRLPSHRLGAVAAALGIDSPRPHRADNDVRVTRALLAHLVTAERPATVRDLWRTAAGARHVDPRIVARAGEALARGLPVRVSYLPSRGGRELLALRVTEVRADLDPPLVLGYLLLSRGRRELRADRILGLELATEG
jgi:DNA polymerase-3 subunit epsilon